LDGGRVLPVVTVGSAVGVCERETAGDLVYHGEELPDGP